ncbi:MAG TPA: hypothetical protein VM056_02415 [Terriglobales bacterium]|nr:hypothetical protein [Terriglobales bacterium]
MLTLVAAGFFAPTSTLAAPASTTKLADAMQRKIDFVTVNGRKAIPEKKSTVFAQDEINAYFAERRLKMPEGVRSVKFQLRPELVTANASIDFDEITREKRSLNPLMYLFTGLHDVTVTARAVPLGKGEVRVTVETVTIDGVTVPKMALKFFVERYVNPKYPNVGLDHEYRLPAKMNSVIIQKAKGTVNQG